MSTSHCREVIDDHMNDSNWKKLVDWGRLPLVRTASELTDIMQSTLYPNATAGQSGASISSAAFDSIDELASVDRIRDWAAEEEYARRKRLEDVTVMDIYNIRMEQHEFDLSTLISIDKGLQHLLGQKYFSN